MQLMKSTREGLHESAYLTEQGKYGEEEEREGRVRERPYIGVWDLATLDLSAVK
jgi:hypothetical protein